MSFWSVIGLSSIEDVNRLKNEIEFLKDQNRTMAEKLDTALFHLINGNEKNESILIHSEINFELMIKYLKNLTNDAIEKHTELFSLIAEQGLNLEKNISTKSDSEVLKINKICNELKNEVLTFIMKHFEKYDDDRKSDTAKTLNSIKTTEESIRLLMVNSLLDYMSDECLIK